MCLVADPSATDFCHELPALQVDILEFILASCVVAQNFYASLSQQHVIVQQSLVWGQKRCACFQLLETSLDCTHLHTFPNPKYYLFLVLFDFIQIFS
jgi:hypothetical protein